MNVTQAVVGVIGDRHAFCCKAPENIGSPGKNFIIANARRSILGLFSTKWNTLKYHVFVQQTLHFCQIFMLRSFLHALSQDVNCEPFFPIVPITPGRVSTSERVNEEGWETNVEPN
jgi:hypothetical protein